MRKCAALLTVDKGEVFFTRGKAKVKVLVSHDEQRRVLKACYFKPTSGHFGVTKTYKRIAEHFYWKGMIADVRELVSYWLFYLLYIGYVLHQLCFEDEEMKKCFQSYESGE